MRFLFLALTILIALLLVGELAYSQWTPTGLALSSACLALAVFFCARAFWKQRHA
jgi:hypothetical protein